MKFIQNINGPFFIIVPLSVLSNWQNEFKRFLPQMRVLKLHTSDPTEMERLKKYVLNDIVSSYDVVLTTYDVVKNPTMQHVLIHSIYWRYVVLDEGHVVKNENAVISQTIRKMHFENALLLTGE
jgi:SNF2 family DNA or RNA helicase